MVGRYTPLVEWLKIENRKGLTLAVLSRFLFIPAFYFTEKYGDQGWMIMLVSLLGLTTGHFNVCILITAPKGYNVSYLNFSYIEKDLIVYFRLLIYKKTNVKCFNVNK